MYTAFVPNVSTLLDMNQGYTFNLILIQQMRDSSPYHLAGYRLMCQGCTERMLIKISEAAVTTVTRLHLGQLSKYVVSHRI
jgi:hypothetical protein